MSPSSPWRVCGPDKRWAVEIEVGGVWATYMAQGEPCEYSTSYEAQAVASWLWQSAGCWNNVRVSEVAA